jgi:hypothetical protein
MLIYWRINWRQDKSKGEIKVEQLAFRNRNRNSRQVPNRQNRGNGG